MIKQILLTITILLILFLSGCGDNSVDSSIENISGVNPLIQEGDYLEQRVREGYILGSNSDSDRDGIEKLIHDTKMALSLLNDRYKRKNAIKFLALRISLYRDMQVIGQDKFYTDNFFNGVSSLITKLSREHNVPIHLAWNLYVYNFFKGIFPFDTYGSSSAWNWYQSSSKTAAEVRNNKGNNKALLLSPTFDISLLDEIQLKAGIFVEIRKSDGNFNLGTIKSNVFKVYASSSYKGEIPTDIHSKQWVEIKIPNLKEGNSNIELELNQFIGEKKLTIAFFFNADTEVVGKNNFKWQIRNMAIRGAGEKLSYQPRFKPAFNHMFNNIDKLSRFLQKNILADNSSWNLKERYGYFAEFSSNSDQSHNNWLISESIDLSTIKQPVLRIKETLNIRSNNDIYNTLFNSIKIKISNNLNPENIEGSTWCELNHIPLNINGNSWVDIAPLVNLTDCLERLGTKGEKINIAFQLVNESTVDSPTSQTTWQIREFSIFDHKVSND